jgi:integrase
VGKLRRKAKYRPYAVGGYRLGWFRGEFCVTWNDEGKRRRFKLGVGTEEEARTELASFAREQEKLTAEPLDTFRSLHKAYIADRAANGKDTDRARWRWTPIADRFGHLRPADMSIRLCREHEAARKAEGIKPHTIYGELNLVRTVINWAVKKKLLRLDDRPELYVPDMPEPRDRRLTRAEVARLIDAAEFPHIRLFLILALATAGRKGAILDLTWSRVDFEGGLIHLRDPDKEATRKGRALLPMNGMARAALLEAKAGATSRYVIEWAGDRVADVKRGVATAFRRAGLKQKGDGAHTIRHSAACMMAEDGVPLAEIAQYLGHADLRTTYRTYARFSPQYLAKAASSVDLPLMSVRSSVRK